MLLVGVLLSPDAAAHAYLERSDPQANSVMPAAPEVARLWFTEPLEPQYTSAELYDVEGNQIATPPSEVSADDAHLLILPLPSDLPAGTYTIGWQNISSADGHPTEGFFSFTIGSSEDVQLPAAPATVDFGGPPTSVAAAGSWLTLLGLMGMLGLLMVSVWVAPVGLRHLELADGLRIWTWLRRLVFLGLAGAIIGSVIGLVDQTLTVASSFSFSAVTDLLGSSSFGQLWLARVAGIAVLAGALLILTRADRLPAHFDRWLLVLFALLPLGAVALNSHAAAIEGGRRAAVAADFAHIVAGGIWVGGLIGLASILIIARSIEAGTRRSALVEILPRFSTLAIASVIVIVVSGFYASWLQVGNLTALTETDYGKLLIAKVALVIVMLVLGGVNLLFLEPRLRDAQQMARSFRRTVGGEVLLGITVILLTGLLTSLPTARGDLESSSGQISQHFEQNGVEATLTITPGAVGANRYTVDLQTQDDLPHETAVLLRVQPEDQRLGGVREIALQHVDEQRFEALGSELSVVGGWDLELILRRPETADWRASSSIEIGTSPPSRDVPGAAPRFEGLLGALAVLVLFAGIPAAVIGLRMARHQTLAVAGSTLMALSILGLLFTWSI